MFLRLMLLVVLMCNGCDRFWTDADDLCPPGRTRLFQDADQDGFGDLAYPLGCALPDDVPYATSSDDCDDGDETVYPGADERCDNLDNDCDAVADEDLPVLYTDVDGDGYGDANRPLGCDIPEDIGFTTDATDCDDDDRTVYPGALEQCDALDNDCDAVVDEELGEFYQDADDDGHGDPAVYLGCLCDEAVPCVPSSADLDDCDDGDDTVHGGAVEICDALDNDCDAETDEGLDTWYADLDEDGHGDPARYLGCEAPDEGAYVGSAEDIDDCDDGDASVYLDADEICDDIDNDCDDSIDEDLAVLYTDADADGFGDPTAPLGCYADAVYAESEDNTDCDDTRAERNPDEPEVCDALDNDCDGDADEGLDTYYLDLDADGHGDPGAYQACALPSDPYVVSTGSIDDCDDDNTAAHPGAEEVCDDADNDCDDEIDEDLDVFYADRDEDGYGDPDLALGCAESDTVASVTDDTDCDDTSAAAYPSGVELCDGLDNDCEGTADTDASDATTWYLDEDGDGVGVEGETLGACAAEGSYTALDGGDCDDANPYFAVDCPWVDVSSGGVHVCGVRSSGRIACWGLNNWGETTPPDDGDDDDYVAVASGYYGTCGLHATGDVECWGDIDASALTGNYQSIEADYYEACAVDTAGVVSCVGPYSHAGEPSSGTSFLTASPGYGFGCGMTSGSLAECWGSAPVSGFTDVVDVDPSGTIALVCALHTDGSVECWDGDGELALEDAGSDYVDISVFASSICALDASDALMCWSSDGTASTTLSGLSLGEDLTRISIGGSALCGLDSEGRLACWNKTATLFRRVPSTQFLALSASGDASCGARGGAVDCWGDAASSPRFRTEFQSLECGANCVVTRTDGHVYSVPPRDLGLGSARAYVLDLDTSATVADIGWGNSTHYCTIGGTTGGELWCREQSGFGDSDHLGRTDFVSLDVGNHVVCGVAEDGDVVCAGYAGYGATEEPTLSAPAVQVSLNYYTGWALQEDGVAVCFGDYCATGTGSVYGTYACSLSGADYHCESSSDYVQLASGFGSVSGSTMAYTCGLTVGGSAECFWRTSASTMPSFAASSFGNSGFVEIFGGGDELCGLHSSGAVECCDATTCRLLDPAEFSPALSGAVLDVGYAFTADALCVLDEDGVVACETPLEEFAPDEATTALAMGEDHLCALDDGQVLCAGSNAEDQSALPEDLFGAEVAALDAGGWHTVALLSDGTPLAWGLDDEGQATVPSTLTSATAITAGARHSCAIDSDGDAVCWGDDGDGQSTPTAAATSGATIGLSAGDDHTCAVIDPDPSDDDATGSVECWGDDSDGQSTPPVLDDATAVFAGARHTCALRDDADQSVTCWGSDDYGQVSDAVQLPFVSLSLGDEHTCGLSTAGTVRCWGRDREGQSTVPE